VVAGPCAGYVLSMCLVLYKLSCFCQHNSVQLVLNAMALCCAGTVVHMLCSAVIVLCWLGCALCVVLAVYCEA
jgi:biotin transporter BioY